MIIMAKYLGPTPLVAAARMKARMETQRGRTMCSQRSPVRSACHAFVLLFLILVGCPLLGLELVGLHCNHGKEVWWCSQKKCIETVETQSVDDRREEVCDSAGRDDARSARHEEVDFGVFEGEVEAVEEGLVFAAGPVVEADVFSESFACLKERKRLELALGVWQE